METIEGLNELIKARLLEKKGNIKLTENTDIVLYGRALGINENQLLFKVLEIEETIDWAEEEQKRTRENSLKSENSSNTNTPEPSSNIIYCSGCNAANEKGSANFCIECGAELTQTPAPKVETEQRYQPETNSQQQNNYSAPEPDTIKKSKLPLILGVLGGIIVVLVLGYFFWGKEYLKDKNAPRMYSFARSLALRSSPAGGGDYNMIGNIPYGSEILVYDAGIEWVNCKVDGKEGYASPKYMLNKMDFQELNAILADEDTRTAVTQTRFKKALLSYFRSHNIIGKMDEIIQNELYGGVSTKEVWQLSASAETNVPNTVYFSKYSNQSSKFNDFACIIKNLGTGQRKIVMFSFDETETPKFEGEAEAPSSGNIANISYDYDYNSGTTVLTPIFTSW
jgi:hypothetical protein